MKNLIITADDFGAAPAVNEAVERAHRLGVLSAASLMVSGEAIGDAVGRAKAMPSLRVGLHLVLVDGRPILPPGAVPDLVDSRGYFRSDMARAGAAMFFVPRVRAQLAAEIEAQFSAFTATGLPLDHVNGHKHFHLHPTVAGLIAKLARAHKVKGVRVPLEPRAVLARVDKPAPSHLALLTRPFAMALRRRLKMEGIGTADWVFGLAWSGAMTCERLAGLIAHLPQGLSEIYMHPATGPYPGSAPGYLYRAELEALTDPRISGLIAGTDIRIGGFGDFPLHL